MLVMWKVDITQSLQVNKLLIVLATFLTPPLAWKRSGSSKKFMVKLSRPINYIKSNRWLKNCFGPYIQLRVYESEKITCYALQCLCQGGVYFEVEVYRHWPGLLVEF
jgi:hypothetical protein